MILSGSLVLKKRRNWCNGNGRLVEAIKDYRSLYDVGLKEAKDAVEFEQKRKAF